MNLRFIKKIRRILIKILKIKKLTNEKIENE